MSLSELDRELASSLLDRYGREIAHMRARKQNTSLALVVGAGFGKPLKFPDWKELLADIADDARVSMTGRREAAEHLDKSQALFEEFRRRYMGTSGFERFLKRHGLGSVVSAQGCALATSHVGAEWLSLVRQKLYKQHKKTYHRRAEDLLGLMSRSYHLRLLNAFAERGTLIVNYNFDDSIEVFLEKNNVRYVSMWDSRPHEVPNKVCVYHPNGYLPLKQVRRGSTSVVFLEESFQSHLTDTVTGPHAQFVNHLSEHTCLFVGLSLEDPVLCHRLHQAAQLRPGHVHYYIQRLEAGGSINSEDQALVRETLFQLYNIVAVFLTDDEIGVLASLLHEERFEDIVGETGKHTAALTYRYYITGCVSSGKSTVISHLYDMNMEGEWKEDMPEAMKDDPSRKSPKVIKEIEGFVNKEVARKNADLFRADFGIHIVDRCPLDALAFVKVEDRPGRSSSLALGLLETGFDKLCPGHVILLVGDPYDMCVRSVGRGKRVSAKWLGHQQESLKDVYRQGTPGVTQVDAREKSVAQVVKDVLRVIHFSPYVTAALNERLAELAVAEAAS